MWFRCRNCGKMPCSYHKVPRRGHSRSNIKKTENQFKLEDYREYQRYSLTSERGELNQLGFRKVTDL